MPSISKFFYSISLKEFLDGGRLSDGSYPALAFEQVPFDHPLFIMFSSGTTGAPKCMVHSVGVRDAFQFFYILFACCIPFQGTLLKQLAEHVLQLSLMPSDVMLFYTTAGWMMWNWLMTALAAGNSVYIISFSSEALTVTFFRCSDSPLRGVSVFA